MTIQLYILVSVVLAILLGIWQAYGTLQSIHGLATNRSWVSQIIFGSAIIFLAVIGSVFALLIGNDRKKVIIATLSLISAGITPTAVH